jgi:hypothetical protein
VVEVVPNFKVPPCKPAVLAMKKHDAHGNPW